jgi:hypothetical protein
MQPFGLFAALPAIDNSPVRKPGETATQDFATALSYCMPMPCRAAARDCRDDILCIASGLTIKIR